MAGYGAPLEIDWDAVANLPIGSDAESTRERRKMFRSTDMNGNGILSLAECDRLIVSVLHIEGVKRMKPVINRAFHAARDIVPAVGEISDDYVDFNEFRYFLIYLKHYIDLFVIYDGIDQEAARGRYSDRRMSFAEFEAAIPSILDWGVDDETADALQSDPQSVFQEIDDNGGGIVLFDEFAHWALYKHIFAADDADGDIAEALDVLRKQKPNLCGKSLGKIKARKAKYRADAKISGQGCLRGDSELKGGYDTPPDGGEELAAGGYYPGGLKAWKASFDRVEKYSRDAADRGPKMCKFGCNRPAFGRYATCCTKCDGSGEHCRRCVGQGYELCTNGCGRAPFGKYETCCTHCRGEEGPHARSCIARGEKPKIFRNAAGTCENGCGRTPFRKYKTCCTHCHGEDGPHARACDDRAEKMGLGPPGDLTSLFTKCKDRRHGLSHDRFREVLRKAGITSEDDVEAMLSIVDKDGNGLIDPDEFLAWLWGDELGDEGREALKENN